MSSVIPFKGQKVAKAFAHLDPNKSLGEGVVGGFPLINYRGKIWSLMYQRQQHFFNRPDDGSQLTYLDVIIVGHPPYIAKTYYPNQGEFDEDNTDPPTCASTRGDKPDPGVTEPQSTLCATCKYYGWTTLPTGRRGKICQDHKKIAVLLMPAQTKRMLGAPLLEPVYLKIPPGSLNALKAYGDALRHDGYPFCAVITRIGFKAGELFQMTFEGVKVLTDAEAPLVLPMLDDPRTLRITGEMPDIREVKQIAKPEKIETGLVEAFSKKDEPEPEFDGAEPETPAPKKRGRPARAKQVDIDEAKPLSKTEPEWDDADNDLDKEIGDLLGKKVQAMLPDK